MTMAHNILGQKAPHYWPKSSLMGQKDVTQYPVRQICSSACLGELTLIPPGFGDLPYPTSELARSATQMAGRSAIVTAAENGDQML